MVPGKYIATTLIALVAASSGVVAYAVFRAKPPIPVPPPSPPLYPITHMNGMALEDLTVADYAALEVVRADHEIASGSVLCIPVGLRSFYGAHIIMDLLVVGRFPEDTLTDLARDVATELIIHPEAHITISDGASRSLPLSSMRARDSGGDFVHYLEPAATLCRHDERETGIIVTISIACPVSLATGCYEVRGGTGAAQKPHSLSDYGTIHVAMSPTPAKFCLETRR